MSENQEAQLLEYVLSLLDDDAIPVITDHVNNVMTQIKKSVFIADIISSNAGNILEVGADNKLLVLLPETVVEIETGGRISSSILPTTVANTSLSNLTTTGKALVSNLAMPSASYVDLTLGTTGSTYTAPADGYVQLSKISGASGERIKLYHADVYTVACTTWSSATSQPLDAWLPVAKGQVITYIYTASGATSYFRFIYAEGSKP